MRHVKEESVCIIEQAIDLNSAIEELHQLSSQEINKLLKDSENFIIQHFTENGSLIQIDVEKLALCLPLHLIAVLVSPGRDDTQLIYLLRGFRLLHSLCDLASRQSKFEQILLEEVKVTEQILDLVFYMLLVLARYKQDHHTTNSLPLLHSALVACSLHLLTGCVSSQWQDLVQVLLAHPQVDVFMDVAFDAVRMDVRLLQIKLTVLKPDISCKKSIPPDAEQTLHNICHQCEASLQFLQSLCQQKLFRERLLRNKELCKNGGILLLARTVLKLDILHLESSTAVAAISRLKSKILSILLQLCETETISYLDEVASSPSSMQLAKTVALEILDLLKTAFDGVPKQLDSICGSLPRGVVLLNSMRLIDIFSDDSNFRSFIMVNITQVLAEIFSLPQEEFITSWCSADLPVKEEDATLEYDPSVAAGLVSVRISTGFGTSLSTSDLMIETKNESPFILNNIPQASYTQQRTSLLVKIIANLHCFVPNICEEQERNLFFNKFLESLQIELPKSSPGFSLTCDKRKAARVCKNLGSLVDHAGSLIPNFLNEEDVQLLSVFAKQLESLVTSAKPEGNPMQEQVQENKFEASYCWEKLSNHGASEHQQEAQSTGGCASPLATKGDPKAPEIASEFNDKKCSLREGLSDNLTCKGVDQFNIADRGLELPDDVMNLDGSRRTNKGGTSGSALEPFREIDKDVRNVETGGSELNSARGKNSVSHMPENGDCSKGARHTRESSLAGLQENYTETMQCEDRQRRKRKRNIMNERQITLIEHALLDEPEMQRNAALLQTWADRLSVHGSELTSSQLKNWVAFR
ncbi:nodulin homeobox isoform X2 [Telopea speciosissima]|uniref:nodulin homeobox isoform X2 n=1 Tax=Telopea speciosissima TaxID=54955 RepID=UPI001CC5CBFE|nr:nodulin homeobox isoform X2 [Telopea speciosissima]